MSLPKRWQSLSRGTVGSAPERYGVYELGDADGEILEVGWGVLRDELKDALAYGTGEQVRWEACQTKAEARELAAEHRERAGL
ncbi:hypothetical protein NGM10_00345 [Halorussus salilacus]|uniref:DUF7508 domain-containing protein n=1 Tax=Halorussus salilacus TaxID=2953750 RepID=UPI0020A0613A|nr:hypothetical protein [Halorussus salilacus]USZ68208.1 hypothetical protein NGM10_00345 [Halorussus salilacus]